LGNSQIPYPQPRPGRFQISSGWTPQKCSMRSSICRQKWWSSVWLALKSTRNLFPNGTKKLANC
jgi:hypothetical protein